MTAFCTPLPLVKQKSKDCLAERRLYCKIKFAAFLVLAEYEFKYGFAQSQCNTLQMEGSQPVLASGLSFIARF